MGFIGRRKRIKDLESGGKMKSKWNWNPAELVLRLKRPELRSGFHGLFQHKTMESNRRRGYLKLHNLPTFTSFMFLNERRRTKKSTNVKNRVALFSLRPSSLSFLNSLLYVSMLEWREGCKRKRDGLVRFSWIWDNEDREREIRDDKGEMTNSREGSAVIRLQCNFSLNDKATPS